MKKPEGVQADVSWRAIGTVKLEYNTNIFIAKIFLKLFFSNLSHPLKLKAPSMVLSNTNAFRLTLIPQQTYFLLVRKIRPFSNGKVGITQPDACRWFLLPLYAQRLSLSFDFKPLIKTYTFMKRRKKTFITFSEYVIV